MYLINNAMKLITCLLLFISLTCSGQESGIKWLNNYSWQEIIAKAKKENKPIFLDCITTTCAPCKRMDQSVYTSDTVAKFVNENFIAVKVQMDRRDTDQEQVKKWYSDADNIGAAFKVFSFPTYIFLSPAGTLLTQEAGFKGVSDFLYLLETILKPHKKYTY